MENKEFLIKLLANEENEDFPTLIKSVQTNKITEYLKLFKEAEKNEIPISIKNSYYKKFEGNEAFVTDIKISFGDENSFTILEIYVDVF